MSIIKGSQIIDLRQQAGSTGGTGELPPQYLIIEATALDSKADKITTEDIEFTDTTKGVILKSPNGTRYRITVADDGSVVTTAI